MIRDATIADMDQLLYLAESFYSEAASDNLPKYDKTQAIFMGNSLIESDDAIFLVCEKDNDLVGMGALCITPFCLFSSEKVASELFWYILPNYRGSIGIKLHKKLEDEAKNRGADLISMVDHVSSMDLEYYYKRKGYDIFERTYMRRL